MLYNFFKFYMWSFISVLKFLTILTLSVQTFSAILFFFFILKMKCLWDQVAYKWHFWRLTVSFTNCGLKVLFFFNSWMFFLTNSYNHETDNSIIIIVIKLDSQLNLPAFKYSGHIEKSLTENYVWLCCLLVYL